MDEITLSEYIQINKNTFDRHSNIILVKDKESKYVYANSTFEEKTEYLVDEILGKSEAEFRTKNNSTERADQSDWQVLTQKEDISSVYKYYTKSGKKAHYLETKTPILDPKNQVIGILVTARNIEDQRQTYEELERNSNLVEIMLDAVPYPIFIKNLEGIYIRINKAYCKDLELETHEIIGKNDKELFGEKLGRYYLERDLKVIREGERDVYISSGIRKDVKYITTKDVLRNNRGEIVGVVGVVNTFQELSHIQNDLMNIQRIESISQVTGGIAHDLNNILTNVVALSSMLLYIEQDEQKKSDLESIHDSARKASALMNKLKTFAKKTDLEMVEMDFNQIIQDTIQLVTPKYRRNYEIVEEYSQQKLTILGDKSQLSQMVMNLIINAFEAMEERKKIVISTFEEIIDPHDNGLMVQPENFSGGKYYCAKFADEGTGIDHNILNQIFEPYFTSKGEEGTGLGLSIVYGVITAHNGAIRVRTGQEKGTEFYIYLPAKE